jgi:hypothetical protein
MRKTLLRNRKGIYLVILVALLVSLVAIVVVQKLGTGSTGGPLGYAISLIRPVLVQAATTTFPVNEAGIAGYMKTDVPLTVDHLAKAGDTVVKQGESYIIVTVKDLGGLDNSGVHVYIGLDGWIVAYYLKDEETSKMIIYQGKDQPILNTLQKGIQKVCNQMGIDCSDCLLSIEYYDFEFPDANKITLIGELVPGYYSSSGAQTNDFYVTVPGTLYEASYTVEASIWTSGYCWGTTLAYISLKVDETSVVSGGFPPSSAISGSFNISTYFQPNIAHHIIFGTPSQCTHDLIGNVALIYKN